MSLRYPISATVLGLTSNPYSSVLIPVGVGSLFGLITKTSVSDWFPTLRKPKGNPPRWVFPVAWTYLYGSMGYAAYLVTHVYESTHSIRTYETAGLAIRLYHIQLALNFAWSPIFFGLKRPGLALIDIISLSSTVFYMTNLTRQLNLKATYFLLPYCAWLSYATYLNAGIWYLNGGKEKLKSLKTSILGAFSSKKHLD